MDIKKTMLLDFAFGIITTIVSSFLFDLPVSNLIFFALLFSVLPDLDFVVYKLFGIHQDKGYKHRDLFHYPLLYLPLGLLVILLFNQILAIIFFVVSFLHFLHDSIAYGRGVKWLFPFSKDSFAFIYLYSRVKKIGLWQMVFVFNEKNLGQWDEEHGDEDWIKNIYYRLHPIALVEITTFLLAVFWLLIYKAL